MNCRDTWSTHSPPATLNPHPRTPTQTPTTQNLSGLEQLKTHSVVFKWLLATTACLLTLKKNITLCYLQKKTCKLLIFKENKHSGKLRASRWLLKQLVRLPSQCGTRVPEKHKLLNQNSTHQTPTPFVSM